MRIRTFAICLWAGMGMALVSTGALADARLVYQQVKQGQQPVMHSVDISAPHLRADHGNGYVLFDAERQVLTNVDRADKQYTRMTQADMERTGKQVSAAMAQAQAMMKNLTPQQRQMAEQMMGGKLPTQKQPAKLEYRMNTGTAKVAGHACTRMQILKDGKPWMKLCVAAPDELGLSNSDYAVLKTMSHMLDAMRGQIQQMGLTLPDMEKIKGVPVEMQDLSRGTTETLVSSNKARIDPARFTVPAGYQRTALPGLN